MNQDTPTISTDLISLLLEECPYIPSLGTIEHMLTLTKPLSLRRSQVVTPIGSTDRNFYIVEKGILRSVDFPNGAERTLVFATKGNIYFSKHGVNQNLPSVTQFEACIPSVIRVLTYRDYLALTESSLDFVRWMLSMAHCELFMTERKTQLLKGTIEARYLNMCEQRPEIIRETSQRIVASYLGCDPAHLSRIRKKHKL